MNVIKYYDECFGDMLNQFLDWADFKIFSKEELLNSMFFNTEEEVEKYFEKIHGTCAYITAYTYMKISNKED